MKRILLLVIVAAFAINTQAQWLPNGSSINNFQMVTTDNTTIDAYQTTSNGNHILIDFSATWCGNCWNYHNSKVLEQYHQKYGPSGSLAQDAVVVFYESDATTNNNDLIGIGTSTIGDWTQGVTHPICNESNPAPTFQKFLSSAGSIGFPSVVVLCSNNTFFRVSTSLTNDSLLRNYITDNCGTNPLSTSSIVEAGFEYDIYPNPASNQLNIAIKTMNNETVTIEMMNTFGQIINSKTIEIQKGISNKTNINTSGLSTGIYLLKMNVGQEQLTKRIMIK